MPNVRQTPGVTSLPGGDAYYRACLEWHLSLNITPKAIHDLGLREVHRIYQNMENVSHFVFLRSVIGSDQIRQ